MTTEQDAEVEAVARRMCEEVGQDPDQRVCLQQPYFSWCPRGQYYFVPSYDDTMPLWHLYRDVARAAISTLATMTLRADHVTVPVAAPLASGWWPEETPPHLQDDAVTAVSYGPDRSGKHAELIERSGLGGRSRWADWLDKKQAPTGCNICGERTHMGCCNPARPAGVPPGQPSDHIRRDLDEIGSRWREGYRAMDPLPRPQAQRYHYDDLEERNEPPQGKRRMNMFQRLMQRLRRRKRDNTLKAARYVVSDNGGVYPLDSLPKGHQAIATAAGPSVFIGHAVKNFYSRGSGPETGGLADIINPNPKGDGK